jgi:hypothetical protein
MPIVRFDPPPPPPKRGIRFSDVKRIGRAVLGGPGGILYEAVSGLASSRNDEQNTHVYDMRPVEVDLALGTVKVFETGAKPVSPGLKIPAGALDKLGRDVQAVLQHAYVSGIMPANVPEPYREVAEKLVELHRTDYGKHYGELVSDLTVEQAPEAPERNEDTFMGGFLPPGGMAGFAQMTPASKLSLMKGSRGRRSTGKRRKSRRKARVARSRKRVARTKRGRKKLVKGSAAAKRFMANLRRRRK